MNIINVLQEMGRGSTEGRGKMLKSSGPKRKPSKSRVRVYDSITHALRNGYIGQIFSTKDADRLYVITKQKWGKDDEQIISGRSAKGFPSSAPFATVKKYAVRTMLRHGQRQSKKYKSKQYWSRKQK
tara:strand:+ start:1729 stop:2109 length:381 start_codon:yes stop_codon:yes gene_type:complete